MPESNKPKPTVRIGNGELLTEHELAISLGECRRTIRRWRERRVIPFVKLGYRTIRYRLPRVLEALDQRATKPR
jgi:hypothetical protein